MSEIEPITREELLLNSIAGEGSSDLTPITRQEHFLSAIAGESDLPESMEPITREEIYYQKILDNGGAGGGGGEATGTVQIPITQNGTITRNVARYASAEITTNVPNPSTGTKQITANGTHDVTDYASASVNVPNSYSASDEGKVVSSGELTTQTSRQVTANGTYDTTLNDEVVVNVPASGITPSGTKNITTNGDHDVTQYATAHVDVPTGITPSGSQTYTQNGTYDVTNIAEAVVNVQSGGSSGAQVLASGTFVGDGTNMGTSGLLLPVGTKMAQTDFIFCFWADNGSNIIPTEATDRMAVWAQFAVNKIFAYYDLSTDGTKSAQYVLTYPTATTAGSDEAFTNRTPASICATGGFVRTTTVLNEAGSMSIVRDSTGFKIKYTKGGGTQYKMMNGLTYNWKVIYFGSDPENDIVEVA